MIHLATTSATGTSFHGITFKATAKELIEVLGNPDYRSYDFKVNMEWVRELDSADVFTIYDWKNYHFFNEEDIMEWHIGGFNKQITEKAKEEILNLLNTKRNKENYVSTT